MRLLAIYDSGIPDDMSRYVVIVSSDKSAKHFTMHSSTRYSNWREFVIEDDRFNFENNTWRTRTDLGRRITFESLSEDLQRTIAMRLWGGFA